MRSLALTASLAAVITLWAAGHAAAGGTVVLAPDKPSQADCRSGSSPRFHGVGDDTLIVLGCATPPRSLPVILAGSLEHVYACFYVVPPGAQDEGPCAQVRSTKPLFGGRLTKEQRDASPVTGGDRLSALRIGIYGSGLYLSGQAPDRIERVWIESDGTRHPAAILPVSETLGARIGATHPFSMFVARIPEGIDTCADGIRVVATHREGRLEATYRAGRDQAYPAGNAPLPGSKRCATEVAWDVRATVKAIAASARDASRLKPSVT